MTVAAKAAQGARDALRQISVSIKVNYSHRQKQLARFRILKEKPNRRGFIDDLKLTRGQVVGSKEMMIDTAPCKPQRRHCSPVISSRCQCRSRGLVEVATRSKV